MADELCPTCHSQIGTESTVDSGRVQGAEGTDSLNNPVPRWTTDPIFTLNGFSGETYRGRRDRHRKAHIQELQATRTAQEEEAGFSEDLKTQFSDIDVDSHLSARHIVELRESTEKLLNETGSTLENYFKFDDEGNEQPQNSRISEAGGNDPQDEWVDIDRGREYVDKDGDAKSDFTLPDGSTVSSPTLSQSVHLRAIHIEDLRHPLPIGIPALVGGPIGMSRGPTSDSVFSPQIFESTRTGGSSFKNVDECGLGLGDNLP